MTVTDSEMTALKQWVESNCGTEITSCEVIADGLNLVVHLSATADTGYVARCPNELRNTAMFVDIKTEYQVLEHVAARGVPVPQPIAVCSDESVLERPSILMRYVAGDVVPLGSRLPQRYRRPQARRRLADELIDTLAQIHTLPTDPFEAVCETHTLANQVAADVRRVNKAAATVSASFTELLRVGDWLAANVPTTSHHTLVHGDYRPGNVLFSDTASDVPHTEIDDQPTPQVSAVLDWETAFIGNPLSDIGYLLLRWRDSRDTTPSLETVRTAEGSNQELERLRQAHLNGLAPFTSAPGSPTRRQLLRRYEEYTGQTIDHPRYGLVHAAFTLAAVWATLHSRAGGGDTGRLPWIDYLRQIAELAISEEFEF